MGWDGMRFGWMFILDITWHHMTSPSEWFFSKRECPPKSHFRWFRHKIINPENVMNQRQRMTRARSDTQVDSCSHCWLGFIRPRCCRISFIRMKWSEVFQLNATAKVMWPNSQGDSLYSNDGMELSSAPQIGRFRRRNILSWDNFFYSRSFYSGILVV